MYWSGNYQFPSKNLKGWTITSEKLKEMFFIWKRNCRNEEKKGR